MKTHFNKIISTILVAVMLLSALPFTASAEELSGTCGDNLTWSFDESTGELLITGTGEMFIYDYSPPWGSYSLSIKSVTISDSVTTIGDHAFYCCDSLTSVTIPDSVTTIGDSAFRYCDSLTSVTIGNSVTTIGDSAFSFCDSLTSVTIPDSVTTIGDSAFYYCYSLTSVTIGDSVTTIGDTAFCYCDSLTSVTIPDSVTTIGDYAFCSCDSLTSVTIGSGVTTIGEEAFSSCYSLKSVEIPDSVTTIGDQAFFECTGLTSVTIPDSVTTIGNYAFVSCLCLTSITVDADNQYYSSDSYGVLYNKDKTELIQSPIGNSRTSFKIPDSVTTIGEYAFTYCISLTSVTMGNSVTAIGEGAFYYCTGLTSVTIPDSVTTIGDYAFSDCTGLTSVIMGDSVTTIGSSAFSGCTSLTSVTIPDSVTSIGDYAFQYCTSLTSVTIGNSVTTIGSSAFSDCTSLTSVIIPDSVTSIGDSAFSDCTSLTSVTIGNSVTTIGSSAFNGCSNLADVVLPFSVKNVYANAFTDCKSLERLKVYSRDCAFAAGCTSYYTTIVGYAGSTAEAYANENGFDFEQIIDDHEHTYSNSCDNECDICGYINPEAGHTYDDKCDHDCNVCGDVRSEPPHTDKNYDGICDDCETAISDILIGITQNFKVKVNETVYIKFIPANSGVYTFYSSSGSDTCGYIFDADKNQLAYNDDYNGSNFSITYTFKAGNVYYLGVKFYNASNSGEIPVTIRLDEPICDHFDTHKEHKDPTCVETGYDKLICDDCGETISSASLPIIDHDRKTVVADPTCQHAGTIVIYCTMCKQVYSTEITDPVDHDMRWVMVTKPTSSADGVKNYSCSYCGLVEDTKVVPAFLISDNSVANIDFDSNTISGFDAGATSIDDYVSVETDGYSFTCDSAVIGTGTVIELTDGDTVITEFTAVVFGDVNGDGWYDGTDSIIVSCLANGLLSKDDVSPAFYTAADCNHDGVIDSFDVAILEQAGLLLANVDQSKSNEELATDEAFIEYLDLIDQTPEDEDVEDEIIETPEVEAEDEFDFIEFIITIIKKFFKLLLSTLPIK